MQRLLCVAASVLQGLARGSCKCVCRALFLSQVVHEMISFAVSIQSRHSHAHGHSATLFRRDYMRQEVTEEGSLPPMLHQEATTGSIVNHSLQLRATGANTCDGRASTSQRASPSQLDQNMLSLGRALYIRAECSFLKLHPSQREVFKSELVIAVAICPELVSNISGASLLEQALQNGCASALLLQSPILLEALTHNALACGQRIMLRVCQMRKCTCQLVRHVIHIGELVSDNGRPLFSCLIVHENHC